MAEIPQPASEPSAGQSPTRYLREPEVLARVGVSWGTIRRWEMGGEFPRRRQLGKNTVGWVESEIESWCASRTPALVTSP